MTPEKNIASGKVRNARGDRTGSRRSGSVVALAAFMTLLMAVMLEYAHRAELHRNLQVPLRTVSAESLRDLNTPLSVRRFYPWSGADRLEAVARQHPASPVAAYGFFSAALSASEEDAQIRLALKAVRAVEPENPRYATYIRMATTKLAQAGRTDEAAAMIERAMREAGPEHRRMLEDVMELVKEWDTDGD